MFFTYNQFKEHNTAFMNAFVDLKVEGWKSYAKALDSYTNGFFKAQLNETTEAVVSVGDKMKTAIKGAL